MIWINVNATAPMLGAIDGSMLFVKQYTVAIVSVW